MNRLTGKIAVVTGSSSGIGRATAELFAKEGATVVLTARRLDKLEEAAAVCRSYGVEALAIQADLSKPADCVKTVEETIKAFGRIDILVNNAGIDDKNKSITNCDLELWEKVISTDQNSVYFMMKEVLPHMERAGQGSIVNISSIGATRSNAGISYTAAKMAVIGMTKNVAIQYAGTGIRCNAVCPGPTETPIFSPENAAAFDKEFARACARHFDGSVPRTQPEDQANAILFFASDESKAVNGETLVVDYGGTI